MVGAVQRISNTASYLHDNSNTVSDEFNQFSPQQNPYMRDPNQVGSAQQQKFKVNNLQMSTGPKERDSITSTKSNNLGLQISGTHQTNILKTVAGNIMDHKPNIQMFENQQSSQISRYNPVEDGYNDKGSVMSNLMGQGIIGQHQNHINGGTVIQGTKSTTALNNVGNLITRDQQLNPNQSTTNSQIMLLRSSVGQNQNNIQNLGSGLGAHNSIFQQQNPISTRVVSGTQNINTSASNMGQQQYFKNVKTHQNERGVVGHQTYDKKNIFSQTGGNTLINQNGAQNVQTGLLPRISNLRNEVTILFKNTNGSQNNQGPTQIFSNTQATNAMNQQKINQNGRMNIKPLSSPRAVNQNLNAFNGQQSILADNTYTGTKNLMDRLLQHPQQQHSLDFNHNQKRLLQNQENNIMVLKDDYSKSLIEHSDSLNGKNKKRLRSNNQNKNGNGIDKEEPPFYTQNDVDDSFTSDNNQKQGQQLQYYTEKVGGIPESQIVYDYHIKHGMIKDDMSIGGFNRQTFSNDDSHQLALTPQIMSSQSNKRRNNLSKQQENIMSQQQQAMYMSQQQKQQFFARRTGSNKEQAGPFQYPGQQYQYKTQMGQIQTSFDQNTHLSNLSPLNAQLQGNVNENSPMLHNLNGGDYQRVNSFNNYKNQMQHYQQMRDQKSDENSPDKLGDSDTSKSKTQNQQDQAQPKIPVICGFHKRVLLLTSQVGVAGPNQNAQNAMAQTRRIRNKNPNCNHNNNFTFYQPSYNNVKYDDSYKKKEEVLRKVFFKECAKEEEKRTTNSAQQNPNNQNSSGQGTKAPAQPSKVSMNDPIAHLKIIENAICQSLFTDYENSKNANNSGIYVTHTNRVPTLMTELGLEQAIVAHKSFLLALIQAGKIINENMFKVLHEFKQSSRDFDNECIYCKYSQYALRESAKVNPSSSFVKSTGDSETLMITDGREGTSQPQDPRIENLVRMFQSQLFKRSFINTSLMIIQRKMNEKLLAKQKSGVPDKNDKKKSLPTAPTKDQQQKKSSTNNANPQNVVSVPQSSLDQLSNQMQKLAKNLSNPKDKEKYLELKEKYYKEFLLKINQSNGISINFPKTTFVPYKYYVGKGNNSLLVRNCLKSRFWWSMGDFEEWGEYNFIWTQWKSNKIIAVIKTNQEVQQVSKDEGPRSGLTSGGTAIGTTDSLMSTQMTVTDRDSNSSVETLLATPTRRKRASTLPQNPNQVTQNNLAANKKGGNSSISNSASKNIKLQNVAGANNEEKEPKQQTSHQIITYGHMENNFHLSNKKAIYYNMKIYYESIGQDWWKVLPLTFHVKEGPNDKEFLKFQEIFKGNDNGQYGNLDKLGKTIWIVKPGENTNRGCGIQVCRELQQIREIVSNTNVNGQKRSYIIQKYIEKPLLYKNRKFDIRCYALITTVNGNMQGYWYNEGYLRTSSKDFNLKNVTNRLIHLTNDAVQKKSDDYGKFESGNKLSYADFQKYLDSVDVKCNIVKEIVPQLKKIATDTIKAVSRKLDPHRRHNTFEVFGYDFMIDEDLRPWLIEVNTNPCLELSAPYLARLIPTMIENAIKQIKFCFQLFFRIAVDPLFPPPPWPNAKKHMIPDCTDNKFELVFNESTDAQELKNLPIDDTMNGIIEEEEMEDEGSDGEEEDLS